MTVSMVTFEKEELSLLFWIFLKWGGQIWMVKIEVIFEREFNNNYSFQVAIIYLN